MHVIAFAPCTSLTCPRGGRRGPVARLRWPAAVQRLRCGLCCCARGYPVGCRSGGPSVRRPRRQRRCLLLCCRCCGGRSCGRGSESIPAEGPGARGRLGWVGRGAQVEDSTRLARARQPGPTCSQCNATSPLPYLPLGRPRPASGLRVLLAAALHAAHGCSKLRTGHAPAPGGGGLAQGRFRAAPPSQRDGRTKRKGRAPCPRL